MPTLIGLIQQVQFKEKRVFSGEILSQSENNTYQVEIKGRVLNCRSGVADTLTKGTRVVVNKADEGYYVVSEEKPRNRELVEVLING